MNMLELFQSAGSRNANSRQGARFGLLVLVSLFGGIQSTAADDPTSKPIPKLETTDSHQSRPLWMNSKIHGTPDPPDPYRLENAFPNATFEEPLAISQINGTRLFIVAQRYGKIYTLEDSPQARPQLLVDLQRTIYGVATHPNFLENGQVFVASVVEEGAVDGSRLSRFESSAANRFQVDRESEVVLLTWLAGGHNGGCVRFGPDGLLYVSTGDGSGWADWNLTGQRIDDLLASILRIDVDHADQGRPYRIPIDNPFVNTSNARPEVYSYGHRNVWKFSFDREGRLWAGDVGQDLWEMIELVVPGGNYGWSIKEGTHPFKPDRTLGPTPILDPLVEHPHSESRSITAGHIWEAADPADLQGCFIYGDYDTGKIWSVKLIDGQIAQPRQLADTQRRIVAFAQNQAGEVLVLDHVSGTLSRIVPALPSTEDTTPFPRLLSQTGLFTSTDEHAADPGLIPYSVNAALWSDGAIKQRWIALPGDAKIAFDDVTYPMPAPGWRFPDETVLVKTFSIEMETGNPASLRRLETRILQNKSMPGDSERYGDQFWLGYTYVWNEAQTDAELLDAAGGDRRLTVIDANAPGGMREQVWHFPSRAECTLCHTMSAKYALGVNTMQMNRRHDYGHGPSKNQLAQLEEWGVFTEPLPAAPDHLPKIVDYSDPTAPLADRARSYLHANCSHCHRLWGGGVTDFQLQADIALDKTGTIDVKPERGSYGLDNARLIAPGHPDRSLVPHRMTLLELGRMPHIGSNVVDQDAVALIREWIEAMESTDSRPGGR